MESILPDLPPLPRRRITLPLSTLAEVARDVCQGYDPPGRGCAYAKAHPLWRGLPAHLHALMNTIVSVCRGRPGGGRPGFAGRTPCTASWRARRKTGRALPLARRHGVH
jgi:hypothetical protein